MIVRCLSSSLKEDQRAAIGLSRAGVIEHPITPGREYVVLGLSVRPSGSGGGSGLFVQIVNDWGQCRRISINHFEVVDARCSKYWHVQRRDDGTVLLWPEEFYEEYFLDDLIEDEPTARQVLADLVSRMNAEVEEARDTESPSTESRI